MVKFMNGVPVKTPPMKRNREPTTAPVAPSHLGSGQCEVSDTDLQTTIRTLTALGKYPDAFQSNRYKQLRAAVYPLVQVQAGHYTARISDALSDSRWADALMTLAAMRRSGEIPKLGAVQRWVRDVDAAGQNDETALLVLDAVIRTAAPEQIGTEPTPKELITDSVLIKCPPWIGTEKKPFETIPHFLQGEERKQMASKFSVIGHEKGATRNPPNLHDLHIYAANAPNAIPLEPDRGHLVRRIDVPFVQGSFFLENVLSVEETQRIIQAAEAIGYDPDVPQTNRTKSILAHNVVWLADESFLKPLYERVKRFLPEKLGGGTLSGINGRFRLYRYSPGAVYRAHVDGAWPCSGRDSKTGEYVYDATDGYLWSRLTFLLYLNEGFEGGETTYFTPALEDGKLRALSVIPRVGCVMVFPHGDTMGCLVHEGSTVLSGTKYIIRTEVLYTRPK
eukprot:PhF_6_TR19100/c0_g1_i1/m.28098